MKVPELLAPAGNLEKLEMALLYGADAVYCGLGQFSLRALAGNLSMASLPQACNMAHAHGKKLYLTLNAFLRPGEEEAARELLAALRVVPVDAYIVADPGLLHLVRQIDPERELHLSTQANTTSGLAAQFWHSQGVKRLNLARELSLDEIAAICSQGGPDVEVFVHGAMCMAWSGRCLLSSALSGRSANRGTCSHPCRWQYSVQEETRPGEYFPIEEDKRGTYIFNSRDLCLIDHLPELIHAGVSSLKIEGRMKSLYYVAAVTRVYRAALDAYQADPVGYVVDPEWRKELDAVSHRPYGTGFLFGEERAFVHAADSSYRRNCDFVGVVIKEVAGRWQVTGRNRFLRGETLELIGPTMRQQEFTVDTLHNEDGEPIDKAQPNAVVYTDLPAGAQPGDLLRRWRNLGEKHLSCPTNEW